jgi:hypothetical protein
MQPASALLHRRGSHVQGHSQSIWLRGDTLGQARDALLHKKPGRYDVDEIRAEPFPPGHTSRQWGRLILYPDGRVEDEPWPWDAPGLMTQSRDWRAACRSQVTRCIARTACPAADDGRTA